MESIILEARILENLVCRSKAKELRLHKHPRTGRHWVEVGGRRFISRGYIQAAHHLHSKQTLDVKVQDEHCTVYELGHHVCSRPAAV